MSVEPNDLSALVRHVLESTRATAICPFHLDVTVRVGDDAAETHALAAIRNMIKRDGTHWKAEVVREQINQQLRQAADRCCPLCANLSVPVHLSNGAMRMPSGPARQQ